MKVGRVTGQIVATARVANLPCYPLLLVELLGEGGESTGECQIAMDPLGAGEGEWVLLACGSAARLAFSQPLPVDLAIIGIIDQVSAEGGSLYRKG